jgi:murein L,D-transpeptidase YafK
MPLIACILNIILFFPLSSHADADTWIIIDTTDLHLKVMHKNKVQLTLENISIGRFGASRSRMKGSNQTPLGTFHINWIKPHSRFYRFFGIDYPNRESADLALAEGRISHETWKTIIDAIKTNGSPPQDTPLGGYLGIHGIGKGDQEIHSRFNWTNGCIALTNTQIDQLSLWLKPGMRVVIH